MQSLTLLIAKFPVNYFSPWVNHDIVLSASLQTNTRLTSSLFPSLHPLFHLAQKMWCCLVFSLHCPNSYRHKPWQPSPVCLSSGAHMIIRLYNTHLFSVLTRKALTKVVKHSSRRKMTTQNKYSAALSYLL